MATRSDPIEELLQTCKDVDGTFHEGKVRAALAWAYRRGFAEMRDLLPLNSECSVRVPQHVPTALEAEAIERQVRKDLNL